MSLNSTSTNEDDDLDRLIRELPRPEPSAELEARVRRTYRERATRRRPRPRLWSLIEVAAAVLLATARVVLRPSESTSRGPVARSNSAVTTLSLEGFQPVHRPKLVRIKDGGRS